MEVQLPAYRDRPHRGRGPLCHSLHRGGLHVIPELYDGGVGPSPALYDIRQFLFGQSAAEGAHVDQRALAALVTQSQRGNFALGPIGVFRVSLFDLLQRNSKHLGSRGLVDLPVAPEDIQHPLFTSEPGNHPGLDGREVSVDEHHSGSGHEDRADQRRQRGGDTAVDRLQSIQLPVLDQLAGKRRRRNGIMGEVLYLHQPSGLPPSTIGAIELHKPADPTVKTDSDLQGVVFLGAGLSQLLADLQHPGGLIAGHPLRQQVLDGIFAEIPQFFAGLFLQPFGELCHTVGVRQSRKPGGLFQQGGPGGFSAPEGTIHERDIHGHAPQVDGLIHLPLALDFVGYREIFQPAGDLHLGHHVLGVVGLEQIPFIRVMLREVSGAPAVGFGGLAGHTEIPDQGLAGGQLPFVFGKAQRLAGGVQAQRIPAIGRLQLRVPPLGKPQLRRPTGTLFQMEIPAEAVPLERGVE